MRLRSVDTRTVKAALHLKQNLRGMAILTGMSQYAHISQRAVAIWSMPHRDIVDEGDEHGFGNHFEVMTCEDPEVITCEEPI